MKMNEIKRMTSLEYAGMEALLQRMIDTYKGYLGIPEHDRTPAGEISRRTENGIEISDYHYCREELYRTKKGTYFIYGEGGALSRYARYVGNTATAGEDFQILSVSEAREWAERKLSADKYRKIFGEPEEG